MSWFLLYKMEIIIQPTSWVVGRVNQGWHLAQHWPCSWMKLSRAVTIICQCLSALFCTLAHGMFTSGKHSSDLPLRETAWSSRRVPESPQESLGYNSALPALLRTPIGHLTLLSLPLQRQSGLPSNFLFSKTYHSHTLVRVVEWTFSQSFRPSPC